MGSVVARRSSGGFDDIGAAIQPEWAFLPLPQHSRPTNVSLASGQPGVVGDQVLLLGEYTMYHRNVGCHDIELYIPDALDTVESPMAIADSLEATARNLKVGWRYETVRVFGVGAPVRLGGRAFTHEVWVHVNSTFKPTPLGGYGTPATRARERLGSRVRPHSGAVGMEQLCFVGRTVAHGGDGVLPHGRRDRAAGVDAHV